MITSYKPSLDHVIEGLFGKCNHIIKEGSSPLYCEKCKFFIEEEEIKDIEELNFSLFAPLSGIRGGPLVSKLLTFLTGTGILTIEYSKNPNWYGFCYSYTKKDGYISKFVSKSNKTFAYNVCWLSEIVYRLLLAEEISEDQIRRMINDN